MMAEVRSLVGVCSLGSSVDALRWAEVTLDLTSSIGVVLPLC